MGCSVFILDGAPLLYPNDTSGNPTALHSDICETWGRHIPWTRRGEHRAQMVWLLFQVQASLISPQEPDFTVPTLHERIQWANGQYMPKGVVESAWKRIDRCMDTLNRLGRRRW
ncbi:hypothetical protein H072_6280 [Dactylellina haptotyla CBS 200.50]|uniref:Uncharacterized protein n=1 Tax=Dactylellina haptotyla (strain CBS 200.50) TaxID=1284197 RepID=S8AFI8_DACHA|nr:hypothetical protein H072_6280 [Dactylellina haptotyla CBS 200.50]